MNAARPALAIAGLAALGALAALAVPRGLADLDAFEPRQTLWRAEQRFPAPAEAQWARGNEHLRQALARDPDNPLHLEALAAWHERGARSLPGNSPEARAYREFAIEQLRRAAVLRPGSPYTWANLALLKVQLKEIDAELARAVGNAARLGPWEPEVQVAMAEVLFAAAERLPEATRAAAGRVVVNGLRHQDTRLFARAAALGRVGVLCALPGVARSRYAMRCI